MALTYARLITVAEASPAGKHDRGPSSNARLVPQEITDGAVRAQKMIDDAQAQIAEKWAHFEERLASTRAQMLDQARAEVDCALASKFVELSALREREIERSREHIVQLACLLAERVLRDELTSQPARLIQFAEDCIAQTRGSSSVVIYANPEDVDLLKTPLEALAAEIAMSLKLRADPGLVRGDLHIESDVGTLDARLGTQLANLVETIRESLRP